MYSQEYTKKLSHGCYRYICFVIIYRWVDFGKIDNNLKIRVDYFANFLIIIYVLLFIAKMQY